MFAVIYQFKVKKDKEDDFKNSWKQLTELIYEFEGSLGSRLHKQQEGIYLAYAQWPDKKTWKNSGGNLPDQANDIRLIMKDSCSEIETLFEVDCEEDLLKNKPAKTKK